MPSNFVLRGLSNIKVRSIAAWGHLVALDYDGMILNTPGLINYWPLNELAVGSSFNYDDIILQTSGLINYWPLDALQEVFYADYTSTVLADGAAYHWPLDDIDSV